VAVFRSTVRADDQFSDDFLPDATGIIGVKLLAFAIVVQASERVGTGTEWVLLSTTL